MLAAMLIHTILVSVAPVAGIVEGDQLVDLGRPQRAADHLPQHETHQFYGHDGNTPDGHVSDDRILHHCTALRISDTIDFALSADTCSFFVRRGRVASGRAPLSAVAGGSGGPGAVPRGRCGRKGGCESGKTAVEHALARTNRLLRTSDTTSPLLAETWRGTPISERVVRFSCRVFVVDFEFSKCSLLLI